jgi:hypothetical protein
MLALLNKSVSMTRLVHHGVAFYPPKKYNASGNDRELFSLLGCLGTNGAEYACTSQFQVCLLRHTCACMPWRPFLIWKDEQRGN